MILASSFLAAGLAAWTSSALFANGAAQHRPKAERRQCQPSTDASGPDETANSASLS